METMRVIEPRHRESNRPKRTMPVKRAIASLVIIGIVFGTYTVLKNRTSESSDSSTKSANTHQNLVSQPKSGKLKTFTGEEFKNLYNTFAYPNTSPINENTPITGNIEADAHIKKIAKERGYQLRSAPITNAFQDVGDDMKLQQRAAQPWLDLKAAAEKDNIHLGLTAAYRSAEEQKAIFTTRLAQTGIPVEGIASGAYDTQIVQVLKMTAIPGYSRHHTGYTIDISCEDQPASSFMYTVCFKWLSANNYEKAKTYGWIPSYPEETELQGPDPESWEYVWVGKDAVTE